jgi:putative protein-disulfide isomerase
MKKEILYVGDPMCSWCWGFAPIIKLIKRDFNMEAPLSIILGGLHAYDSFPMDENYKSNIRHHWQDVNTTTGAIFDYRFFDRKDFILDTEPACRAVVTVRQIKPDATLSFYESISRSFYSENKDTTDLATFKPLVERFNINFKEFSKKYNSTQLRDETKNDFEISKKIGVTGFPTLLVKEDKKMAILATGFRPYRHIKPAIIDWLTNGLLETLNNKRY